MPFHIIRSDITKTAADAIVNTANPLPVYASGTDRAIYMAAGAEQLLAERKKIGPLQPGQAALTHAFQLPAKYIIHTVGPRWQGGSCGEEETLRACFRSCLQLALKKRLKSIAFPLISTGTYGFPADKALTIALSCFQEFLLQHDMEIYLVVFGSQILRLSEKLVSDIDSYVDDHYVQDACRREYDHGRPEPELGYAVRASSALNEHPLPFASHAEPEEDRTDETAEPDFESRPGPPAEMARGMSVFGSAALSSASPAARKHMVGRSLEDILNRSEETFQQQLFRLIREKGMKNSEVYKRANLQKQLFSKIKADKDYIPKKNTVLALCLALQLTLDETLDLLARAGYTLSPGSKADLVVEYFIDQKVFDIYTVEAALYEHQLPMLTNY